MSLQDAYTKEFLIAPREFAFNPEGISQLDEIATPDFLRAMPKAELHLHLDGSLSPELLFSLAQKNAVELPYKTLADVEAAYQFTNLQSFLDIYYQGASVLKTEDDFYALTQAYLEKCVEDNVRLTELSIDPQTHTARGIPFATVINGTWRAMQDYYQSHGIVSLLTMDYLRHLSEEDAFVTLEQALPFKDKICAVGLDSSEMGFPPSKFLRVFAASREAGFHLIAHAGEEGPPAYIWEALQLLNVERIDHGVRAEEDAELVKFLTKTRTPLTLCPLSNLRLCVIGDMREHNILRLLDAGCRVMVNSDDPTYFGGFVNDNYLALHAAFNLTRRQALELAHNSFTSSFATDAIKQEKLDELYAFAREFNR